MYLFYFSPLLFPNINGEHFYRVFRTMYCAEVDFHTLDRDLVHCGKNLTLAYLMSYALRLCCMMT